MEVILLERVGRLGAVGDVVRVKDGYARNYLLPRKKVMRATENNKKVFEAKRADIEAQNAASRVEAETLAKQFEGVSITLTRQSSEEGKLFGSVTVRDVAEALEAMGHPVQKSQLTIGVIKNTGTHPAKLQLHPEVILTLDLNIVRNEQAS